MTKPERQIEFAKLPSVRLLLLSLIVSLFSGISIAQIPDSLRQRYDSLDRSSLTGFDSKATSINNRIDSIQLRANDILSPNLTFDNVAQRFRERLNRRDSLRAVRELDSIKGDLQHKIDSLSALDLPTDKYRQRLDSVRQLSPMKYFGQAESKASELQSKIDRPLDDFENKINKPVNNLEARVNEKLTLMNQEGGAAANLPGSAHAGDLKLPGAELKTSLDPNTGNLNVPGVGNIGDIKNPLGDIGNPLADQVGHVDQLKEKANDIRNVPQAQIDRLKSIDEVQRVQGKVGEANGIVDKAQAYQQDAAAITRGDIGELEAIPGAIENKVASLDEVKELQKQTGEISKYQDMISSGNNPEAIKAQAKELAVKYATDHFAGKQEALKAAMDKVSKLKGKYSQVSSLKDLPKRAPNPMKGKPFIERLIPGFTFQIQKSGTLMLDMSPVASYRFTGRFTAGAGWNERLSFSEWNKVISQDRIYGPRVFSSFAFRKGFSLKAEVEKMNVYLPTFVSNAEGNRAWVWSVFAGFKKDYTFYKKIKGNVQVLYNLYDDHDNSPYLDRLNVRMGFEFPVKKKAHAKTRSEVKAGN